MGPGFQKVSEGSEDLCHDTLSWQLLLLTFQWTTNFTKYGFVYIYWSFKVAGHDPSLQRFILAAHPPLHSAFLVLFEKLTAERKHISNGDETRTKNHLTSLLEVMEQEYVVIIAMDMVGAMKQLRASHTITVFPPSGKPTLCHSECKSYLRNIQAHVTPTPNKWVNYSHCIKYMFNQMTHCILQRIVGEQSFSMLNSL